METSASDKCLERLGTSLNALFRNPGVFLTRLHPGDRSRYAGRLKDATAESEVQIVLYDDSNRPRRDKVALGQFVEYVDEGTSSLRVGLVVGCMLSRTGNQPQDMVLVVELPAENGAETAKMPPADSVARIISTSAITCKIDVEQRSTPTVTKVLPDDAGFVLAMNMSFYGVDQDGTHAIGSYVNNLLSIARSRRGEMFATTDNCRLLSVELDKARVRDLAPTKLVDSTRKSHHETEFAATPSIQIRGLCFAEGRPAALDPKLTPGACQMYGVGKDVPGRGGDCLCTVSPSGKCEVVFELGRKDVVALAVVPMRLSAADPVNIWSRVGPSDADSKAIRYIIWTEKGGLFVVDETRRCLQQLGGDLVRSLQITAIAFDHLGDLYAAGSQALYSVTPTGKVTDVAALDYLPGRAAGLCAVPRQIAHPNLYGDDEEYAENQEQQKSPTRSRSKSWWFLTRFTDKSSSNNSVPQLGNQPANGESGTGAVTTLLRLLRLKPKASSSASPVREPRRSQPLTQEQGFQRQPRQPQATMSSSGGSFSGRRVSNPLLPMEGTSMGETNRRGSGTLTRAPQFNEAAGDDDYYLDDQYPPAPPPPSAAQQRRSGPPAQPQQVSKSRPAAPAGGPYFPDDDEDDTAYVGSIRPPPNPPPPNTATATVALPTNTAPVMSPGPASGGNGRYKDVPTMLHALGLGQYVADFRSEELVDMDLLASMWKSERDFKEMLKELGVGKLGHREMIAHAIKQHVEG